MDNQYRLIVNTDVRSPSGTAEPDAALEMLSTLELRADPRSLGADKGYDTRDFVADVRALGFTPHAAQQIQLATLARFDGRATRHLRYAVGQRIRKRVQEGLAGTRSSGGGGN